MFKPVRTLALLAGSLLIVGAVSAAQWKTQEIGVGTKGSAKFEGETITMTAITGDIWDAADTAMYVYQETTGDVEISARLAENEPANPEWGKVGVMIRQSVDADSANAFLSLTGNHGFKLIHRDVKGGQTSPDPEGEKYEMPFYLKMTRVGDLFTALTSTDGKNWKEAGGPGPTATIVMKGGIVAGLAMSSNDAREARAVFDSVDGTGVFVRPVEPMGKLATTWASLRLSN